MTDPLRIDAEAAVAGLRKQQEQIKAASQAFAESTSTATSMDQSIEATVDAQGHLTGLKFRRERYRELAPAELASKIVEVVRQAQRRAAETASVAFAGLLPGVIPNLNLDGSFDFDFDALFDGAAERLRQPLLPLEHNSRASRADGEQRG